jgi:hypothetical protein
VSSSASSSESTSEESTEIVEETEVEVSEEKPEGNMTDAECLEKYGIDRLVDKQAIIDELTTKYPAEDFEPLSTARMIYQLGWNPTCTVNYAGSLSPDAACIVYLEYDESQKENVEASLFHYVNWLKTNLVEECETDVELLRLSNTTYEVRDTFAIYILPGAWMRDPDLDQASQSGGSSEYTEYEMYEYGIPYAINDIKTTLGF